MTLFLDVSDERNVTELLRCLKHPLTGKAEGKARPRVAGAGGAMGGHVFGSGAPSRCCRRPASSRRPVCIGPRWRRRRGRLGLAAVSATGASLPGGAHALADPAPDVAYGTVGRELLWAASTLPVDRAHSHLRDDLRALMRASFRAEPGRSYRDAYRDPFAVMAEIWIALFWRNFRPRQRLRHRLEEGESPRRSPAWSMGVARSNEPRKPDLATLAWDFRLGVHEAVRMSRWLQQ